jgi:hypothetical protein
MPTTTRFATSADDPARAGVADSIERYVEQSRAYAAQGRTRMAMLAMWAADVEVLQSLLWERGLGSAPDPDAQLAAVAAAVDSSLRGRLCDVTAPADAKTVVVQARAALTAAFDESVHVLLEERFLALDHLECPLPPAGAAGESRAVRLDGRSAPELVTNLRTAAADCMAVAGAMAEAGLPEDALHQARLADVASFEVYLIIAALAAGDDTLATVDLRWDIAIAALDALVELPADLGEAIRVGRDALVGSVAPSEEDALRSAFERVTAGSA